MRAARRSNAFALPRTQRKSSDEPLRIVRIEAQQVIDGLTGRLPQFQEGLESQRAAAVHDGGDLALVDAGLRLHVLLVPVAVLDVHAAQVRGEAELKLPLWAVDVPEIPHESRAYRPHVRLGH